MTIGRRWRLTTGYALGTVLLVIFCTYIGLLLFDSTVDAPRQSTLRESVIQTERNGENLCEFAVATADAFHSVAQSVDLTAEQEAALVRMVDVADNCQENSERTTSPP